MKSFKSLLLSFLIISINILFIQCKKNHSHINISLYDKPLNTIQKYLNGSWKLEYEYGGFCGSCYNNFHDKNFIWSFDNGITVKQYFQGYLETDTTILWKKDKFGTSGQDSTFVMQFYDKRLYPYLYQVQGIFNDSLVIRDWSNNDIVVYHFSKQN